MLSQHLSTLPQSLHRIAIAVLLAVAPGSASAAPKYIVIGLDGASLNVVEPYAAQGVIPNIAKLLAEGGRGDLKSFWPLRTPQVWTSIATGKLPGQHGLWDQVSNSYYNPPEFRTKARKLLTTGDRRSKAIWQLLDSRGLATLTVGWISSWPAESLAHGAIVAPAQALNDPRQSSIKGSFWRDAKDQVAPARLWPEVKKLIVEPQDVSQEELARLADVPPPGDPLYKLPYLERYVYTLRWSLARAKTVEAATLGLLNDVKPDLLLAYFQCSDSLLHRFWVFQKSTAEIKQRLDGHGIPSNRADELHRRFGKVVEGCYRDLDERIGRILKAARGPDTTVLIVSDHGFGNAPVPHRMKDEPYGGNHRDYGIIIAAGPNIAKGSHIDGSSVLDLTPSLLYGFGMPAGADMRGGAIKQLFDEGELAKHPPEKIPSYEAKPQTDVPYAEGYPERKHPPAAVDE